MTRALDTDGDRLMDDRLIEIPKHVIFSQLRYRNNLYGH